MFEAWREIFSSGLGEGMAKYAREVVAISIVVVVVVCGEGVIYSRLLGVRSTESVE